MENNFCVQFNLESQWAKDMLAPFVGSMACVWFRRHYHHPHLLSYEYDIDEAGHNACEFCSVIRSMGYVAFAGYTRAYSDLFPDDFVFDDEVRPTTIMVCNMPFDRLCSVAQAFYAGVIEYYTPQSNTTLVSIWKLANKAANADNDYTWMGEYMHLLNQQEYENWDIEDMLSLAYDLSACTRRVGGFYLTDLVTLSSKIETSLISQWGKCSEKELLARYADVLNNMKSMEERRSISRGINALLDEGLLWTTKNQ